jgi:hypothetical protein
MSFSWVTLTYLDEDDFRQRVEERRKNLNTGSQP